MIAKTRLLKEILMMEEFIQNNLQSFRIFLMASSVINKFHLLEDKLEISLC